ncbi:helix-turn-helix domain-containing protein [Lachnospiraceae bacterium ZAX-1]
MERINGFGYCPIQIPFLLNENFKRNVSYSETVCPDMASFAICFWEMKPRTNPNRMVENIILADACVDLVVDAGEKAVGFAGMKKTEFHYPILAGSFSFGFRLKPGAFQCLTGLSAEKAMDGFIPLRDFDTAFSENGFFKLQPAEQKNVLKEYFSALAENKKPTEFMELFDKMYVHTPENVSEICNILNYSQKQCERLFKKYFGLTPKMILSVLRFQNALRILTSAHVKQSDILRIKGYYDQPHLNKNVKQLIGLTPLELIRVCREDVDFIQ